MHPVVLSAAGAKFEDGKTAAMTLVGAGIHLTTVQRATDRFSRPAYMSSLPPPLLHRANTGSSQDLIQELAPLAQQLALRAQKARKDEPAGGEDTIE